MIDAKQIAAKPEDLGIDSEKLEMVFARAKRDVDDGTLPSAQVAVARHGKLAGMRTFGTRRAGRRRASRRRTTRCTTSSPRTKAIVAAAVWLLFEDGPAAARREGGRHHPRVRHERERRDRRRDADAARRRLPARAVRSGDVERPRCAARRRSRSGG